MKVRGRDRSSPQVLGPLPLAQMSTLRGHAPREFPEQIVVKRDPSCRCLIWRLAQARVRVAAKPVHIIPIGLQPDNTFSQSEQYRPPLKVCMGFGHLQETCKTSWLRVLGSCSFSLRRWGKVPAAWMKLALQKLKAEIHTGDPMGFIFSQSL